MDYISKRAAILNAMALNAPSINEDSFRESYEEIKEAIDEDAYPVLVVAAAIHEFSKMINEHFLELKREKIDEKYKED